MKNVFSVANHLELNEVAETVGWVVLAPFLVVALGALTLLVIPVALMSRLHLTTVTTIMVGQRTMLFYGPVFKRVGWGIIMSKTNPDTGWGIK